MSKLYKSSDKRLVDYFEMSRNKWKERSDKYQKEKRKLGIKHRDVADSRDRWREECMQLREQIQDLDKKKKKAKELLNQLLKL